MSAIGKLDYVAKRQFKFEAMIRRSQKTAGMYVRMMPKSLISMLQHTMNPSKSAGPAMKVTNIGATTMEVAQGNPETCPHDQVTNHGNQHGSFRICRKCGQRWKRRIPADRKTQVWEEHGIRGGKGLSAPGSQASSRPPAVPSPGLESKCQACGTGLQEVLGKNGPRLICQNYPHCAGSQKNHPRAKKSAAPQVFADSDDEMKRELFEDDTHAAMQASVRTFMDARMQEMARSLSLQQTQMMQNAMDQQQAQMRQFASSQAQHVEAAVQNLGQGSVNEPRRKRSASRSNVVPTPVMGMQPAASTATALVPAQLVMPQLGPPVGPQFTAGPPVTYGPTVQELPATEATAKVVQPHEIVQPREVSISPMRTDNAAPLPQASFETANGDAMSRATAASVEMVNHGEEPPERGASETSSNLSGVDGY